MVQNLFPNFLEDPEQYGHSERFWQELWSRIDLSDRTRSEWTHPWLETGSPELKDGNPIFSAYSPVLGRGIRVIQEVPIGSNLEIQAWLDSFGGDTSDPDPIHELVIACVLSDPASKVALALIAPWVRGQSPPLQLEEAGLFLPGPLPISP